MAQYVVCPQCHHNFEVKPRRHLQGPDLKRTLCGFPIYPGSGLVIVSETGKADCKMCTGTTKSQMRVKERHGL